MIVFAMAPMAKQMHKETSEQKHKWEIWCNVLPMVEHEIDPNDDEKTDKHRADSLIFHTVFSLSPRYPMGYLYKQ